MKILVLAALAVVTNGDVSHLASSGYNYKPPTSYGVPLNSVSGSAGNNIFSSITPTAPSNNIQLPVRGHESFNIGSSFGNKGTTGQLGTNFNTLTGSNGFGFGPSGFDNSDSSNFNQISSGLYSEPHKGGSFNLLSNLNSGYNYPSNTGSSGVSFENKNNFQPTQTEVSKHLYFFSAPDEPASLESRVQIPVAPAKKNVKIIFIKTPSFAAPAPIQIPVQQQNQEKTIVYVLVKKPEEQAPISIPEAVPTVPAKPEVYFIKYKTQKEAEEAISQVQTGASNAGASISANPVDNEQGFISTINTQSSGNQPSVTFVNTGAQSGVGFLDDRNNFPSSNVGSSNVGIGSGCDSNSDGSSLNLNCNNGGGSPRPENIGSGTGDSGSFLSGQKPTTETVHQQYGVPKFCGWYILREWNEVDFDSKVIMQNLHVKYGVTPFFKITVEPNPHSPGQNSIRISPSGLGLPNKEYYYRDEDDRIQLAYKELIRDVIIYMSSARIEATKFGNDMFSYEKRIAEITPNPEFLQNPITTYNPVSISELKETVLIQFYDILTAMYPESNITENTEVIVTSLEYLNQISQIIATTDRRTMNGYLMWTLVRTYIPFLSQKFVSTVDTFNAELFGIQQPLPRWEVCSQLARRFMSLAVDALIEKTEPTLNSNVTRVVNETFNSILSVVQNRLERFKISSNLQKQLQNKLSTLRLQIGLPRKSMDEHFLKMYYQKLKIIKNELFESVRNGMLFLKKLEEQALAHQGVSSLLFNDEATVFYSSSQNTVIIPNSLLRADVFENEYPSPIIYGRLGVEIAHAVVSSVLPFDSFWTADKKILSSFHMTVNESLASVKSNTKCLNNYILNMNVDVPYSVVNETSLWTLKQLAAVDVAHEALTQFLMQKPHTHQPGLDLEDPALFFLTYAQAQCSESTNQHQLYDKIVKFQLPQRTLLHLAWAQLPKFSEALDCSFNKKYMCRDIF